MKRIYIQDYYIKHSGYRKRTHLIVCRQVHDTVHHIFSSWFWSAPVIKNLQNGILQSPKEKNRLQTHIEGI